MKEFISVLKYIRRNSVLWVFGLILPAFASLATNIFYANRLERFSSMIMSSEASLKSVGFMLVLTGIVLVMLSCVDDIGKYVFGVFFASTETEIKHDFLDRLIDISMKKLQGFNQGELISLYNWDTAQSTCIASSDIHGIIYPLIVGSGYLIAIMMGNKWIGLIMLGLGVCVIITNFFFLYKLDKIQHEILIANEAYVQSCNNAIQGKMSIRQYAAKKMMSKRIEGASLVLTQNEKKMANLQTLKTLISGGLANMCCYLLTPLACIFAVYGYISVPVVLFIHQVCRCFISHTQNFASVFIQYNIHALSYRRINKVLSLQKEKDEHDKETTLHFPESHDIRFEKVNVFYGEKQVLDEVSFTISPGEIIGIRGESGSGKSTLTKAFLQLVDYEGKISIGGLDCKRISLEELRRNIAFSPEHNDLFQTTVYENIQVAKPEPMDEDVQWSMSRAAIDDGAKEFMMRDVGDKGEKLSGGQRQKVSIARALLKNAPIMILDEPTASLDANSEAKVLQTINALKEEGKIIILITHKDSTLSIADRILHIEEGRVFEEPIMKMEREILHQSLG